MLSGRPLGSHYTLRQLRQRARVQVLVSGTVHKTMVVVVMRWSLAAQRVWGKLLFCDHMPPIPLCDAWTVNNGRNEPTLRSP